MAIIQCPNCREKISSRTKICSACNTNLFENNLEQELSERKVRNKRFKRRSRLQNLSFLLVLLFAAGTLVLYSGLVNNDEIYFLTGKIMVLSGFIGYISLRVLLFLDKNKH